MATPQFTPGPWASFQFGGSHMGVETGLGVCVAGKSVQVMMGDEESMICLLTDPSAEATASLIAAAPDHALICWAMCVQDARWEEWVPFDGKGEFCFAGLKYATSLDEFGCPRLTDALRTAITRSQMALP